MHWLLHKQKAEWLYLFLNDSCVCEQFFCNRIGMGKIEAEGMLSLKEHNLTIRKRRWMGIHLLQYREAVAVFLFEKCGKDKTPHSNEYNQIKPWLSRIYFNVKITVLIS